MSSSGGSASGSASGAESEKSGYSSGSDEGQASRALGTTIVVPADERRTRDVVTKHEASYLIGLRATQIDGGSQHFLPDGHPVEGKDASQIALEEFQMRRCPLMIRRGVGTRAGSLVVEDWDPNHMVHPMLRDTISGAVWNAQTERTPHARRVDTRSAADVGKKDAKKGPRKAAARPSAVGGISEELADDPDTYDRAPVNERHSSFAFAADGPFYDLQTVHRMLADPKWRIRIDIPAKAFAHVMDSLSWSEPIYVDGEYRGDTDGPPTISPADVLREPGRWPLHTERIAGADLSYPIYVARSDHVAGDPADGIEYNGEIWFVADGAHRIARAVRDRLPAISALVIPPEVLEAALAAETEWRRRVSGGGAGPAGSEGFAGAAGDPLAVVLGGRGDWHRAKPKPNSVGHASWKIPDGFFIDPGYNDAERAAIREIVFSPSPCLPVWMDQCPRTGAAAAVAYRPRLRGRDDNIRELTVLHHGQRKLFVSELQCLLALLTSHKQDAVLVYAGAAPGDHLHFLARLFPGLRVHAVDPAEFRIRGSPEEKSRIVLRREFFTRAVAAEYSGDHARCEVCEPGENPAGHSGRCGDCEGGLAGGAAGRPICDRCRARVVCPACGHSPRADIFVSDIRIGANTDSGEAWTPEFEAQVAVDMAAQFQWMLDCDPRLGAMHKFRPPYIDAGARLTKRYPAGRILTQTWPSVSSTETRLVVQRAREAAPSKPGGSKKPRAPRGAATPFPDSDYDIAEYQDWCAHHNMCRRAWAYYGVPEEFAEQVRGYDGCFDCANEANAWREYCDLAGLPPKRAARLMATLTAEINQRLDRPRGSFHGFDARPMAVKRPELWEMRAELASKERYRGSEASKSKGVRIQN